MLSPKDSIIQMAKKWKQSKFPSTDEWINKMWHIYTMEYYSAIKNNKVMISATTCMNLENIMQSERSQTQKTTYFMSGFLHSA